MFSGSAYFALHYKAVEVVVKGYVNILQNARCFFMFNFLFNWLLFIFSPIRWTFKSSSKLITANFLQHKHLFLSITFFYIENIKILLCFFITFFSNRSKSQGVSQMERGHFLPGRALVGHPSAVVPQLPGQRPPSPQVRRHWHAVRSQAGQVVEAQRG